ncbi:tripartite tricarboxylate transporter TctB family protein [Halorubrum sp. AD140]|uniref:tripartite tricarboxylate transporter TctB family protein n=1 Tax=Halorubrum sp. AD140 TaxID=3050073 RepID=UPI0031F2E259
MAQIVGIGSFLILIQNFLPGPIQRFVGEDVSMTESFEEERTKDIEAVQKAEEADVKERYIDTSDDEETGDVELKDPPLHEEWGVNVNNTVIMIIFSSVYFALGWAAGFLYVTPLFVFAYMTWFRVSVIKSALLAVVATLIVYGFIVFLLMPFDQGALIFTGGL